MKLTKATVALLVFFIAGFTSSSNAQDKDWRIMIQNPQAYNFYDIQKAYQLDLGDKPYEKGLGMKQYKRWEYYWESRVDAEGNFPKPGAVLEEMQRYYAEQGQQKSAFSSSGNWTQLGPIASPANGTGQLNGNGRLNCIAFHPTNSKIIYAGAPSGGFWKSTDKGNTWRKYVTGMTRLGVSSIVVHPTKPNIIYIGTGDRDGNDVAGYGVWRSTNGGLTWSAYHSGMPNLTVNELIIDPRNPKILIAACSDRRIYRSTNGGANWRSSNSLGSTPKDIAMHPTNSKILYAAGTRLHRSTNGGVSWTQITSGLPSSVRRMALAVSPNKPNWLYVLAGKNTGLVGIYRSTNSGVNFSSRTTRPNILGYSLTGSDNRGQAWYDLVIAADPKNANVIYTGGVNLWKSTNGGSSMTSISYWVGPSSGRDGVHADQHALEFSPHTNHLYNGNDGGLYVSSNNGNTWNDLSSGLAIAQVYKIGVSQQTADKVINGYQDNGTAICTGGYFKTEIGGDGMECAIDPNTDKYMYGTLYYGDIRRSTNSGSSFSSITGSIGERGAWVTPYTLDPNNSNRMFAGYDNVWRNNSVRSSSNWTQISNFYSSANIRDIAVAPNNSNVVYISKYDNSFRVSTNANSNNPTWENRASNLPVNALPLDIAVDPQNWKHVYIALNRNIYESYNAGQSWRDISSNLPNINLNTIVIDKNSSNGAMYVGMDVGVYYKDNTMTNWVPYSTALPNIEITELEIHYSNTGCQSQSILYAATYGQGLWKSHINGAGAATTMNNLRENFESQNTCSTTANCGITNCAISGAWNNVANGTGDDIDWRVDKGGTPSTSTGPSVDYSPGTSTGKYAYVEGSGCYRKKAFLVSDCVTLNNDYSFAFRYHAYGSNIGSLHVDVYSNGSWRLDVAPAISGNQGNSWKTKVVNLAAYRGQTIKLRLRAITGSSYRTDIAIDDLHFVRRPSVQIVGTNEAKINTTIKATCTGKGFNQLTWTPFEEQQAETYEIQKYIKNTWKTVETVDVEEGRALYKWEDATPAFGENRYRVAVVNSMKTERSERSEIATTNCEVDMNSFTVYPNPFSDQITLQFYAPMTANLPYRITNTLGQVIHEGNFQAQEGDNNFVLPTSRLPQGLYLLHTQDKMVKLIKN